MTPESNTQATSPRHQRWYDHDPVLVEVIELLRVFKTEVHAQAEVFVQKIESAAGIEAMQTFYQQLEKVPRGNRWYDDDPVIFKAIELLRVVPPDAQRQAAMNFLESLKKHGFVKTS